MVSESDGLEFGVLEHLGLEFTALLVRPSTLDMVSLTVRVVDWDGGTRDELFLQMHERLHEQFVEQFGAVAPSRAAMN